MPYTRYTPSLSVFTSICRPNLFYDQIIFENLKLRALYIYCITVLIKQSIASLAAPSAVTPPDTIGNRIYIILLYYTIYLMCANIIIVYNVNNNRR